MRAMAGERTGFAYSDEVVPGALLEAVRAARAIARAGGKGQVQAWRATAAHELYLPDDPIASLADADKVALLTELDRSARDCDDPRVRQVVATLARVHEVVLIAASDGTLAADVRAARTHECLCGHRAGRSPRAGYAGTAGATRSRNSSPTAGRSGCAREAVRQATVNLDAICGTAGTMTVVLVRAGPRAAARGDRSRLEGDFKPSRYLAFSGASATRRPRRSVPWSTTARCPVAAAR